MWLCSVLIYVCLCYTLVHLFVNRCVYMNLVTQHRYYLCGSSCRYPLPKHLCHSTPTPSHTVSLLLSQLLFGLVPMSRQIDPLKHN